MALNSKESNIIHNKTGSELSKLKDNYDNNEINFLIDVPEDFPALSSLIYQMQLMQNDIDELRRYAGTEQKDKLDTISVGTNQTINFTMTENRGKYTLTITLIDSSGKVPITKSGTLTLL